MKKNISFILLLALLASLAACSGEAPERADAPGGDDGPGVVEPDPAPEPDPVPEPDPAPGPEISAPRFTREEFPRLDGSTSTAPLAVAMAALMLGESEEAVAPLISFSRTTNSYYNLLYGGADLLIAAEGSEEVYAERERLGFAWEQTPFAIDAFVFVVNEANPVESLTVEQIRDIYTGKVTSWAELGGADEPIIALQRDPQAGSQSLMEKLVMRGTPMTEPPKEYVIDSMGGLMKAVRGYDASAGAIGYSVYYYAQEMRAAKGLKLLKIEGAAPEPEAIRSGAYPLTNPYYTVIAASEPEDSPARVVRDWLLSEDGQRLAAKMGYVSVMDLPTAPRQVLPLVGTRLFEGYTDRLIPGDYGTLLPYAGVRVTDSEFAASGCLYGLMTVKGQVVVDPVYSQVSFSGRTLLLTRIVDGVSRVAAADVSGGRCTGFDYTGFSLGEDGAVLYSEDGVTLLGADGTVRGVLTPEDMGITREQYATMRLPLYEGGGGEWVDGKISVMTLFDGENTVVYYDIAAGELGRMDGADWYGLYPSVPADDPAVPGAWSICDSLLGRDAPAILELWESREDGGALRHYFREDGTPIPELTRTGFEGSVTLAGGLVEVLDTNTATYYDLDTMEVVFRTYLGFDAD